MTASNPGINRRDVLHIAAASGAASLVASQVDAASDGKDRPLEIVDTNVSLFHWPFRRLPLDVTEKLVKKLDKGTRLNVRPRPLDPRLTPHPAPLLLLPAPAP